MRRGELYLYQKPRDYDPRRQRVFVVVGRQGLIDSSYSTVICAPVYSRYIGLSTQVLVGVEEGLKHESAIYCDELTSLEKSRLTNYVGMLSAAKLKELNRALAIALELPEPDDLEP
ncbi:type II toxin-antitoxin system PemK/MazF family toxin [Meiothermus cerbereus]|uniref:type II toxin-antitoxin system PemK/MazF family toxin n=1 Tax=Meiothermus cerbereus TaxID=65552 RepID=UPI0004877E68|nr:type II toxin-antitoxin system PemK/MazF family toxin [Meiothermus cerbereus]